jgi:exosome complex component RRP42
MQIRAITEEYLKSRYSRNLRDDNRQLTEYRKIVLKTGIVPSAEGSAEIFLGNTHVITGVKIGLGEPMPDTPEDGNLITSNELLPMASEAFDAGPPSPESIEIARVIDRGIRAAGVVDTSKLFIEAGKVWEVFIDVHVFNYDGNMFDAGTLSAVAALLSARMPRYEDGKVIREGDLGRLPTGNIVTSCTYAKVVGKVVLDPDSNEEAFASSRITVANDEQYIRAMQKGLSGSFTQGEIESAIEMSFDKSKTLREIIKKAVGD